MRGGRCDHSLGGVDLVTIVGLAGAADDRRTAASLGWAGALRRFPPAHSGSLRHAILPPGFPCNYPNRAIPVGDDGMTIRSPPLCWVTVRHQSPRRRPSYGRKLISLMYRSLYWLPRR